jgi:hypothetical protein
VEEEAEEGAGEHEGVDAQRGELHGGVLLCCAREEDLPKLRVSPGRRLYIPDEALHPAARCAPAAAYSELRQAIYLLCTSCI